MTTNIQLEAYIKRHKAILGNQIFLGVMPSDELPRNPPINSCLIVNYSPEKDPGTLGCNA